MRRFRFAAWVSAAFLATAALTITEGSVAQTQQAVAQTRFNKGRDLFIARQYEAALVEFRAATALVESPNTRLYIARCERELGHFARAFVEYEIATTEADDRANSDARYVATSDAAKQESKTLLPKLGHVTITGSNVPSDVVIEIAGSPMNAAGIGVAAPVDPGRVEIKAKAKGFKSFQKTIEVAAGDDAKVAIELEIDPNASVAPEVVESEHATTPSIHRVGGSVRIAGYIVGGVGAVGVGLFATFASMAQVDFSQLQNQCGTHCGPVFSGKIDDGKRDQFIANLSLGLGAAALLTGAILIAAGGSKIVDASGHAVSRLLPFASPTSDGRGGSVGVWRAF